MKFRIRFFNRSHKVLSTVIIVDGDPALCEEIARGQELMKDSHIAMIEVTPFYIDENDSIVYGYNPPTK